MQQELIEDIRNSSRKIVRELGFLNKFPKYEDIGASQIHILLELSRFGKLNSSALADSLQLDKSTISRSTFLLVDKGFIEKIDNLKDGRSREFILTQAGIKRLQLSHERAHRIIHPALSILSADQRRIVVEGMNLYAEALEKTRGKSWAIHRLSKKDNLQDLVNFISTIQAEEFEIQITDTLNPCLLDAHTVYADRDSNVNFWVAKSNNELVGTIALQVHPGGYGELRKFFVKKEFRGSGLSGELLSHLLNQAQASDLPSIYLGTTDRYHAAHKFYEKNNFIQIKKDELPKGFKICEVDSVFYRLDLPTKPEKPTKV